MKNKFYKNLWFWMLIISVTLFAVNIGLAIKFNGSDVANIFTAISGWVSGVYTLFIGIIAYNQSKQYKKDVERNERYVDIVVESVKVVNHSLAGNVLGRICVPKDTTLFGKYRFLITLFAYQENPIFDVNIEQVYKDNKVLVSYDLIQPMQKGEYGRTFLCKNEFMQLVAEIPLNDNLRGKYNLNIKFKNQYEDIFIKELEIYLGNGGVVTKINQGKSAFLDINL